jgi:hypothetical protein
MRRARLVRGLGLKEITIARTVFKNTIPYDKVLVSDGLGYNDREFTMPTSMPATWMYNVDEDLGKYVMHCGDGYYGMSYRQNDKETLIHELVHVWQGEHSSSSWDYVFGSMFSQALLGEDAYEYDRKRLQQWDDYNPEQQAYIVQHWFAGGMKEKIEEDRRFYFIKAHLWGEKMEFNWITDQYMVKPLPGATLDVLPALVVPDLKRLLEQRFHEKDVAGYTKRIQELESYILTLQPKNARLVLDMVATRPTDEQIRYMGKGVAYYFYAHLAGYERERLIKVLKDRAGVR